MASAGISTCGATVEMQAEQNRRAWALEAAARHAGVCWSALGPAPYEPRDRDAVLAAVAEKLAARRAWRDSPPGGFLTAVVKAQAAAHAAYQAGERARAACSRDATGEAKACAAAAAEMEAQARLLLVSAQAARAAAVRFVGLNRPGG